MAHSGGFDMNEEDEAFEDLAKRQGDWGMQGSRKHQIMRYENDAMREVQRLGQKIEQEPVVTKDSGGRMTLHLGWDDLPDGTKLYTTPPQRTWLGLTKQQQLDIFAQSVAKKRSEHEHYMAIEQALKEQNQ